MKMVEEILSFWLDDVGADRWYAQDEALDAEITDRFTNAWNDALAGRCGLWLTDAAGALAYVILTDQFSRNMFRDDGRAFAADKSARAATKIALDRGWDNQISEPARHFYYMPLMHSENLADQDRAVRLIHSRLPETGDSTLIHAKVHREIIRKFGRFPYRNAALERKSTEAETAFMEEGGYGAFFRQTTDAS